MGVGNAVCRSCRDKPKFGGLAKLRQRCVLRACSRVVSPPLQRTVAPAAAESTTHAVVVDYTDDAVVLDGQQVLQVRPRRGAAVVASLRAHNDLMVESGGETQDEVAHEAASRARAAAVVDAVRVGDVVFHSHVNRAAAAVGAEARSSQLAGSYTVMLDAVSVAAPAEYYWVVIEQKQVSPAQTAALDYCPQRFRPRRRRAQPGRESTKLRR